MKVFEHLGVVSTLLASRHTIGQNYLVCRGYSLFSTPSATDILSMNIPGSLEAGTGNTLT